MTKRPHDAQSSSPPLVLHMDINKTLIICDPVSGVETEAMVNSLLSECSWGAVVGDDGARSWRLLSPEPSTARPPALEATTHEGRIMTFNEALENVLRPDKATKKQLKARFTLPGEVGEALRPHYERVLAALRIPEAQRAAAAQALPKLALGQYYILPSFFRLINHLEESGRDFHIVFRTFGIDAPEVAKEWNLFCDGAHPLFTPSRPERTRGRRLELPRDSGVIHRTGLALHEQLHEGVHLAMVSEATQLVTLAHGVCAVYNRMMAHLTGNGKGWRRSLALQDDYNYWAEHGESDNSGKLLFVDTAETPPFRHIFFDDNIERGRAHIVDARELRTMRALPFTGPRGTQGRWLVKAEPFEAILDEEYLIKALRAAEERM